MAHVHVIWKGESVHRWDSELEFPLALRLLLLQTYFNPLHILTNPPSLIECLPAT